MTLDRVMFAFAGAMVLLSVVLTQFVSPYFMWFTVFVGANMLQSAFTGFCPPEILLRRKGLLKGEGCSCRK